MERRLLLSLPNESERHLHLKVPPQFLRLDERLFHLHDFALRRLHLGQTDEVLVALHPEVHALRVPYKQVESMKQED